MATASAILDQVCNRATCPQCGCVATATDRCRCLRVKQANKGKAVLNFLINKAGPVAAGGLGAYGAYAATGDPYMAGAAGLAAGTALSPRSAINMHSRAKLRSVPSAEIPIPPTYGESLGSEATSALMQKMKLVGVPAATSLLMSGHNAMKNVGGAAENVRNTTGQVDNLVKSFAGAPGEESPVDALRKGVTAVGKAGETAAGQAKQIGANVEGASQQIATAAGDIPKMTGTMAHTAKVVDQTAQAGRGLAKTVNDTLPQLTAMGERATSALDSIGGDFGKFREGLESAGNWVKDRAPYFAVGGLGVTGLYAASAWWQAKKEEEKRQRLKMILSGAHIN